MTRILGNFSLCAAVLVAVGTLLVSLRAVRFGANGVVRTVRRGIYLQAGLLTFASALLMYAEVTSDFSIDYVVRYTETALPMGYKIAAFWAGQEGSLLLWAWILGAMGTIFAMTSRKSLLVDANTQANGKVLSYASTDIDRNVSAHVVALCTAAVVTGFFAALMLFAANPFSPHVLNAAEVAQNHATPLYGAAPDGRGLNPMLQDPGMLSHPPILFIGYAGYTFPFALLVGALLCNPTSNEWVSRARIWAMVSWIFLGAGIILGANWAYVELGWGGYWAWDPVENASLLPWLTGTALLHSIIGQKQRGMFKRWNAGLAAVTFLLCIFGTYLTRSGIVDSVHTFGASLVGTFFGAFLILTTLFIAGLVIFRWPDLRPERKLQALLSREGAILAGNILLCSMTAVTLFGTIFPVISRNLMGEQMAVKQEFYNKAVLPMAIVLVVLMGLVPMLSFGKTAVEAFRKSIIIPAALAALSVGALLGMGITSMWAHAAAIASAIVIGAIGLDLVRSVRSRQTNTGENILTAAVKVFDANHRRYGSHVVHAGVALMVIGIAASSIYGKKEIVQLSPGEGTKIGAFDLKLHSIQERRDVNYAALQAAVIMSDARGNQRTLMPELRQYDKTSGQLSADVSIRSTWREDVYLVLSGYDPAGSKVTMQVLVNPMVSWIWTGGIVLTIGAIFCILPRFIVKAVPVEVVEPAASTPVSNKARRRAARLATVGS